ncbi:MAG: TIGR04282 family arsenosugar biosynthesis glycosyltransferase, partial [Hyphomicrobiaceae bacterium]
MRRDQQTLIIMVKRPRTGRVKTRLARDIGDVSATWFYRHTSKAVVSRLSRERLWQTILAVAPDASVCDPIWPRGVTCVPQGHGDLGERMLRVINRVQFCSVVLIGTDIPAIRPVHIAAAFR